MTSGCCSTFHSLSISSCSQFGFWNLKIGTYLEIGSWKFPALGVEDGSWTADDTELSDCLGFKGAVPNAAQLGRLTRETQWSSDILVAVRSLVPLQSIWLPEPRFQALRRDKNVPAPQWSQRFAGGLTEQHSGQARETQWSCDILVAVRLFAALQSIRLPDPTFPSPPRRDKNVPTPQWSQ